MKTVIAAVLATLALAAPAATPAQPTAIAAKTFSASYTSAVINGAHKCLHAGEYCAIRAEHQYERYGYECSRRYSPPRLRRR